MNDQKLTLSVDPQVNVQLAALFEKYNREGKDISCYLEKLIQEKNLDYTDYLNLDTLLTLQKPRTAHPDEIIFITFHQIVELYFNLSIWELQQLTDEHNRLSGEVFYDKVLRINAYIQILIDSFPVILMGLDKVQFQKFRYALFPASGFQSYQFRQIELYLTDLKNLVSVRNRPELDTHSESSYMFDRLYWKKGMINPRTGGKSPTLLDFEERYDSMLFQQALNYRSRNVWQMFNQYYQEDAMATDIISALRKLDELFNIHWAGLHYRVAMKHLTNNDRTPIKSTGDTNWRKYLHPKFQRIIFFPKLWKEEELNNWGSIIP